MTFSGLRSRCTIWRRSAWSSADSMPSRTPATWVSDMCPMCGRSDPPVDVLHRDVRGPVVLEVVVDRDDVGVAQRARQPRLAQEALGEGGIGLAKGAQLLQRDQPVEVGLARQEHGRHAAPAQLLEDLVAPDRPRDADCPLSELGAPVPEPTSACRPTDNETQLRGSHQRGFAGWDALRNLPDRQCRASGPRRHAGPDVSAASSEPACWPGVPLSSLAHLVGADPRGFTGGQPGFVSGLLIDRPGARAARATELETGAKVAAPVPRAAARGGGRGWRPSRRRAPRAPRAGARSGRRRPTSVSGADPRLRPRPRSRPARSRRRRVRGCRSQPAVRPRTRRRTRPVRRRCGGRWALPSAARTMPIARRQPRA